MASAIIKVITKKGATTILVVKAIMNGSVSNVWSKLIVYCGRHDEPQELKEAVNGDHYKEPYYVCPCDGCQNGEYYNRLKLKDYEAIYTKLEDAIFDMGVAFDLTNFRFELKRSDPQRSLAGKVFAHTDGHIRIELK